MRKPKKGPCLFHSKLLHRVLSYLPLNSPFGPNPTRLTLPPGRGGERLNSGTLGHLTKQPAKHCRIFPGMLIMLIIRRKMVNNLKEWCSGMWRRARFAAKCRLTYDTWGDACECRDCLQAFYRYSNGKKLPMNL